MVPMEFADVGKHASGGGTSPYRGVGRVVGVGGAASVPDATGRATLIFPGDDNYSALRWFRWACSIDMGWTDEDLSFCSTKP